MDFADRAQIEEARALQEALHRRRKTLTACGACHYCNEPAGQGLLFCNRECAGEYERERAIRPAQGEQG